MPNFLSLLLFLRAARIILFPVNMGEKDSGLLFRPATDFVGKCRRWRRPFTCGDIRMTNPQHSADFPQKITWYGMLQKKPNARKEAFSNLRSRFDNNCPKETAGEHPGPPPPLSFPECGLVFAGERKKLRPET